MDEQILGANFSLNGVNFGPNEVDMLKRTTRVVFEVLEKYWATQDCVLVDMKIEFGVSASGGYEILPRSGESSNVLISRFELLLFVTSTSGPYLKNLFTFVKK